MVGSAFPAAAQPSVAGVTPPAALSVFGRQLQLAGCGARVVLWEELYALGLYLPQSAMERSVVLDPETPKAVRLYALYDGEIPEKIPEQWRRPLRRMLPPDLMDTVQAFFDRLASGDVATIAYAPDEGTAFQINGTPVADTPGHRIIEAMLRLWIGDAPVSEDVRRELLQGGC
jgi:hypothetical protein